MVMDDFPIVNRYACDGDQALVASQAHVCARPPSCPHYFFALQVGRLSVHAFQFTSISSSPIKPPILSKLSGFGQCAPLSHVCIVDMPAPNMDATAMIDSFCSKRHFRSGFSFI